MEVDLRSLPRAGDGGEHSRDTCQDNGQNHCQESTWLPTKSTHFYVGLGHYGTGTLEANGSQRGLSLGRGGTSVVGCSLPTASAR